MQYFCGAIILHHIKYTSPLWFCRSGEQLHFINITFQYYDNRSTKRNQEQ